MGFPAEGNSARGEGGAGRKGTWGRGPGAAIACAAGRGSRSRSLLVRVSCRAVLASFFHLEAWLLRATYHADPGGRTPAGEDTGSGTGCAPAAGAAHTRTIAAAARSSCEHREEDLHAVRT